MSKPLFKAWLVGVLLGAASLCPAQAESAEDSSSKPVAVVAVAAGEELLFDLEYVAKIAGRPEVPKGLRAVVNWATAGKGLAGLDKTRPFGAVIRIEGERSSGFAFVPITDLDQLYATFKPLIGEVTDLGDGLYKVEGKNHQRPAFVKEAEGGWLFLAERPEILAHTPANPGKLIAGLTEHYDVAVRLHFGNVPDEHRQKFIAKVEQLAERKLKRKDGEDEQEYAARKIVVEKLLHAAIGAAKEIDQVTFGYQLDRQAQNISLEVSVTAPAGSKAAERLAGLGRLKTDFGGFRLPGAAVSGVFVAECRVADRDRKDLATVIGGIRARAFKDIDAKEESEERAQAAKQLVAGLLDVAEETIASGRVDVGIAVVLKPKGVTFATGRYIANGDKLQETLTQLVEAVRREHPAFVEQVLKTNVVEHNGVHFHTVSLPIPENAKNREKLVKALGDPLLIVIGIGPKRVYLSAGKHAEEVLRQAIVGSESSGSQTVPPVQFSITLSEVAKFVAAAGNERQRTAARNAAAVLSDPAGKDHLHLSILPTDRGVKLRLAAEEGVLKLLGSVGRKRSH